jgi:hypothetical protein
MVVVSHEKHYSFSLVPQYISLDYSVVSQQKACFSSQPSDMVEEIK